MNNREIPIAVIGISHRSADVSIREKASFSEQEQNTLIRQYAVKYKTSGILVLSTCNRTEIYVSGSDAVENMEDLCLWLDTFKPEPVFTNSDYTYLYTGIEAVRHFFRVASSLDSLMIGEPQITGQVKTAYENSRGSDNSNIIINKMYHIGMQAEKLVRSKTYLTDGAVSVSFAGVELARKIFGNLEKTTVLMIGAGETAELAATHFAKRNVKQILVVNRTLAKAERIAENCSGRALPISDLDQALNQADVVITATSSTEYVLTRTMLEKMAKDREYKSIFLIDLAIPRDIDPEARNVDGVFLYNLDSLQEIVRTNIKKRENEIPRAEKIVDGYVQEYIEWFGSLPVADTITQLNRYFEEVREKEFERLKGRFSEENLQEAEYLSKSLVKKLLHKHIVTLRQNNQDPGKQKQHMELMSEMYQLNGTAERNNEEN